MSIREDIEERVYDMSVSEFLDRLSGTPELMMDALIVEMVDNELSSLADSAGDHPLGGDREDD